MSFTLAIIKPDALAAARAGKVLAHLEEKGFRVRAIRMLRLTPEQAGDFYAVDPGGSFDVVAYFDGFGIGSDDDQRLLLQRIAGWLSSDGCALIDVLTPWYFAKTAGNEEEFPEGSGIRYREDFDADGGRMTEQMWRAGREDEVVTQSLRCYGPADFRLLLEGTGLLLVEVEPYEDQWYGEPCALEHAMVYLAKLAQISKLAHI